MKTRNPIAKAVTRIRPQVKPDKRKSAKSQLEVDELYEYAAKRLRNNNRKLKS